MEYKFSNIQKKYANANHLQNTKEILKNCKVATKYDKVLSTGTPKEQFDLGWCITNGAGFLNIETSMLALPLFYAAAKKGHAESQYQMYIYLHEDKHADAIIYLTMAVDKGYLPAQTAFFTNYVRKLKAYIAQPDTFKKILKIFQKSKDEFTQSFVGLYYENIEHDYKNAIKYYKNALFEGEIERLTAVLYEQEHPSKALREEIIKKYPKIYKIVANKIVHNKK